MRYRAAGNRKKTPFVRIFLCVLLIGLLVLSAACQTPPKKSTRNASAGRNGAGREGASALNAIDLFSSSAERFGTDPRASRPALVTGTVFAAVGGAAVLLSGAVLVSAARAGRTGRPRRTRGRARSA